MANLFLNSYSQKAENQPIHLQKTMMEQIFEASIKDAENIYQNNPLLTWVEYPQEPRKEKNYLPWQKEEPKNTNLLPEKNVF